MIQPRDQPLAVLLVGLVALVVIAQLHNHAVISITISFPILSLILGISLAVVQLKSGFTIRRGISRDSDPQLYLFGLVLTSAPFIAGGLLIFFV